MEKKNTISNTMRCDARDAATVFRFLVEKQSHRPSTIAELFRLGFGGLADIIRENFPELSITDQQEAIERLKAEGLITDRNISTKNLFADLSVKASKIDSSEAEELLRKAQERAGKDNQMKRQMEQMMGGE